MTGDHVDETSDEWNDPVEETETEVEPGPAAFVLVLIGAGLLVGAAPGVTTLLEGGSLGGYGGVGAGVLFLAGLVVVYAAGLYYGEETAERGGS